MSYAALIGTTIYAYLFDGLEYEPPYWFDELILPDCESDGFGNLVWALKDDNDEVYNAVTITPNHSVILMNQTNGLKFMLSTIEEVDEMFFQVGDEYRAALKEDCVEYFCFEDVPLDPLLDVGDPRVPKWVHDYILSHYKNFEFDSFGVFIMNRKGKVQYLTNDTFTSCYIY